jgi:adenylyltransferase and sulfurtransferase
MLTPYTLILDCTDSPSSRYLVSDASILAHKPLISASAIRLDGQLTTFNNPPRAPGDPMGKPCYRCVWPRPPPPESVRSCADGGILGPVVGVMGVLQALEAVRVVVGLAGREQETQRPSMLLFSAGMEVQFRTVRLRPTRKVDCKVCSGQASITAESLENGSMDYVRFCGIAGPGLLPPEMRVSAKTLADRLKEEDGAVVLDVRDKTQFGLCALEHSVNVPWDEIAAAGGDGAGVKTTIGNALQKATDSEGSRSRKAYVVCRLGNDSQDAVRMFRDWGIGINDGWDVKDVIGGLKAWKEEVDEEFPEY